MFFYFPGDCSAEATVSEGPGPYNVSFLFCGVPSVGLTVHVPFTLYKNLVPTYQRTLCRLHYKYGLINVFFRRNNCCLCKA